MTDVIYDAITNGVDMVISASVLSSIVILLYMSSVLSGEISMSQATSETVAYYREFNQYNDTEILASDVIGTVLKYRKDLEIDIKLTGDFHVVVDPATGIHYKEGTNIINDIQPTSVELSSYIQSDTKYRASLITVGTTGGIGTVKGIKIEKII